MGGEMVIVTAGESESPHRVLPDFLPLCGILLVEIETILLTCGLKDLPPATRFMYLAPIGFYLLDIVLVGINVNYLDPNLYHIWEADSVSRATSPFLVALSYTSIQQTLPSILNACFILSAYTAAYISSPGYILYSTLTRTAIRDYM